MCIATSSSSTNANKQAEWATFYSIGFWSNIQKRCCTHISCNVGIVFGCFFFCWHSLNSADKLTLIRINKIAITKGICLRLLLATADIHIVSSRLTFTKLAALTIIFFTFFLDLEHLKISPGFFDKLNEILVEKSFYFLQSKQHSWKPFEKKWAKPLIKLVSYFDNQIRFYY